MNPFVSSRAVSRTLGVLACSGVGLLAQPVTPWLTEGVTFELGGTTATVQKLEALPCVESDYTRRFRFDSADNPKLHVLRQRYQLEAVVAPGRDEFDRQVLLLDWVHHRFTRFGRPTCEARGALEILEAIEEGHTFFCSQYAHVFVSAAASLGWVDRVLALRRHQDPPGGGSSEHSTTEIWSNQYRKWIMMDPTAKMFIVKDALCDGTRWHVRAAPANPAMDPYFPIHQAAVTLTPTDDTLGVRFQTLTPNFQSDEVRQDGGPWRPAAKGKRRTPQLTT